MKVKTGSSIDFQKNSQLENATMQVFSSISNAQSTLTKNGMFGMVDGVGIHINLGGTVVQISNTQQSSNSNQKVYYQNTAPSGSLLVGDLWYDTTNASLKIWTNTTWLGIGGASNSSLVVPVWVANQSYLANQIVQHLGDLWINITNNTIATTTFNPAEWNNLTKQDTKIFELLRTHAVNTTNNNITLDSSGLVWSIKHDCKIQYPTVDVIDKATNKMVYVDIEFTDIDNLKINIVDTLTNINKDLKVRILC